MFQKRFILYISIFLIYQAVYGQSSLKELAGKYAYPLEIKDGKLRGPGAELLLFEATRSDFFMIGEDPGIAEIPDFSTAIYRHAYNIGLRFTHFAIETGPVQAQRLENIAIDAAAATLLKDFFEKNPRETPFYTLKEEANLLKEVMAIAETNEEILWGLDIDTDKISRYVLNELLIEAPDEPTIKLLERELRNAERAYAKFKTTQDRQQLYLYSIKEGLFTQLEENFQDDPVALQMIKALKAAKNYWTKLAALETREALNIRNRWMQEQFKYYYDYALSNEPKTPKVMFKLRATHLYRGNLSGKRLAALGKYLSDYAEDQGFKAFNVKVLAGKGSIKMSQDLNLNFSPDSTSEANASWMEPFTAHAENEWKVFELKAMRNKIADMKMPAALRKLIEEYDALIILGGSKAGTVY